MGDDKQFLEAIRAAPRDQSLRLVYADWLEDRGDERSEYLRIQAMLLDAGREQRNQRALSLVEGRMKELQSRYKELRSRIDTQWLQVIDWPMPKPKFSIRCIFGLLHSWDGCVCSHCEAICKDYTGHASVDCKCIRCGQTTGHDLVPIEPDDGTGDHVCRRCGARGWGWV